jgi:hypothetical protein
MFADILSDWDLLATEMTIRFFDAVHVGEPVEMRILVDEKDGDRLAGQFECIAPPGRMVLRGSLRGISSRGLANKE